MEALPTQILAVAGIIFLSTLTYMFIKNTSKDLEDGDFGTRIIWIGAVGLCLFSILGLSLTLISSFN